MTSNILIHMILNNAVTLHEIKFKWITPLHINLRVVLIK